MSAVPYPVRVEGRLDPQLSRGLWLVKWILAIPHYIVLVFLWLAFLVVSVIAFFAILFTTRYPRGSVFRRETASATSPSRMVAFQTALPGVSVREATYFGRSLIRSAISPVCFGQKSTKPSYVWLVLVLVVFGVVTLLFTGRYPRGIFDFVVGMNRWVLRVVAYAALMTDSYPPFRLDQGETEPVAPPVSEPLP